MAETLFQKHLRVYSEDALIQKFRSEKTFKDLTNAEYKLRNAILDEGSLLNGLIASNPSQTDRIEIVRKRKARNENVRSDLLRYMNETKDRVTELSNSLQVHLYEYSNSEIASAGFVTHTIVSDYKVNNDSETKIIKLDEPSLSEYGIANSLDKWRDGSKIKIYARKKK